MVESEVKIIVNAIDNASKVLKNIGTEGKSMGNTILDNWKAIGAAAATAGAAIELAARQQGQLSTQTDQIAIAAGVSSKEVRQMALDVAGAGDDINETLRLISVGVKEGLTGDALKQYAEYWDSVSDASGIAGDQLAEAAVALEFVGVGAENAADSADALGWALNNTTQGVAGFLGFLEKTGPELGRLGLDINDAVILFDQLEEAGYKGKKGITAVNDAAKGATSVQDLTKNIKEQTGVQIEWGKSIDGSSEKLTAQAAAVEANLTPIQEMTAASKEFFYANGEVIQSLASLVPALASVGPALGGLKQLRDILAGGSIAGSIGRITGSLAGLESALSGASLAAGGLLGSLLLLGGALAVIIGIIAAAEYQAKKSGEAWDELAEKGENLEEVKKNLQSANEDLAQSEKDIIATNADLGQSNVDVGNSMNDLGGTYDENGNLIVNANQRIAASAVEMAATTVAAINLLTPAAEAAASSIAFLTQSGVNLLPVNGQNTPAGTTPTGTNTGTGGGGGTGGGHVSPSGNPYKLNADGTYSTLYDSAGNYVGPGSAYAQTSTYSSGYYGSGKSPTGTNIKYLSAPGDNTYAGIDTSGSIDQVIQLTAQKFWEYVGQGYPVYAGGTMAGTGWFPGADVTEEYQQKLSDLTDAQQYATDIIQDQADTYQQTTTATEGYTQGLHDTQGALRATTQRVSAWGTEVTTSTEVMATDSLAAAAAMGSGVSDDFTAMGGVAASTTPGILANISEIFEGIDAATRSAVKTAATGAAVCNGIGCGKDEFYANAGWTTHTESQFQGWEMPTGWSLGLPKLASGGESVGEGFAIVGDSGPELAYLGRGASIAPLSSARGAGGNNIHLHIGTFIGDRAGIMKLVKEIKKLSIFEDARRGVTTA